MMAPSFIRSKWSLVSTLLLPVTVQNTSPSLAASVIDITRKPSITASSALVGSTSVTITSAPAPRARLASPRPHQPYPAITNFDPASRKLVARMMPSMVDCREDVVVIGVVVLTLDGKHGNALIADQAGGDIILSRQRIRGAQDYVSAAVAKANRPGRSFRRYVQTGGNADTLQRLVLDELFADDLQHFH